MSRCLQTASTDERLVRCAAHDTSFYASFPRRWSAPQLLQALAAHFEARGHRHPPFETIDLVPLPVTVSIGAQPHSRRRAG